MRRFFLIAVSLSLFAIVSCKEDPMPNPNGPVFDPTAYSVKSPLGLPPFEDAVNNPMTLEGVALGRKLFFDPILSADSTLSCSGCHGITTGLVDGNNAVSIGIDGIPGTRNSMPIFNMVYTPLFSITPEGRPRGGLFWDSRAANLEEQALLPIQDPIEMHNTLPQAIASLQRHKSYPLEFFFAFGDSIITPANIGKAIAQYERSIVSGNTPFDQMLSGQIFWDDDVFDGYELFIDLFGGDCFHCHGSGALFTDFTYRNNGLDPYTHYSDFPDPGLGAITGDTADYGKFKVPSLRNLKYTAPYMHDGRFETLEEVIDFYSEGLNDTPFTDQLMEFAFQGGAQLTSDEKSKMVKFLLALSDDSLAIRPEYQNPFVP
jgi:cytochrome c peroxidase